MWSTLFAFSFLIAVAVSLAAIRLNFCDHIQNKIRLSDTDAGNLEPANVRSPLAVAERSVLLNGCIDCDQRCACLPALVMHRRPFLARRKPAGFGRRMRGGKALARSWTVRLAYPTEP